MTDSWRNTILVGDVREKLKELPDESIHCVVTSPPYWGLRDYGTATWEGGDEACGHKPPVQSRADRPLGLLAGGTGTVDASGPYYKTVCGLCGAVRVDSQLGHEETPEGYVDSLVEVFREVWRVLRKDGTVWLNLGDSYANDGKWGGETSGKQSYLPDADRRQDGRGKRITGLKPKDLVGIPWRVALALQADGWYLRCDIIWSKPAVMPESVTDRPTKAHEYIFLLTKSVRYFYDAEAVKEPSKSGPSDVRKMLEKRDRIGGLTKDLDDPLLKASGITNIGQKRAVGGTVQEGKLFRNRRSVWEIATEHYKESHFAVYPTALVKPCIQAGTSEYGCCSECGAPWRRVLDHEEADAADDENELNFTSPAEGLQRTVGWEPTCDHQAEVVHCVVLDIFMGSGTTGYVAKMAGRDWVGVELNPEYVELAKKRIGAQASLF